MMQRVRGEASACLLVAPLSLHMSGSGHPHTEQSAPCILQALVVAAEAQIASLKPRAAQFYRSVEVFLCLQMRCHPMATASRSGFWYWAQQDHRPDRLAP